MKHFALATALVVTLIGTVDACHPAALSTAFAAYPQATLVPVQNLAVQQQQYSAQQFALPAKTCGTLGADYSGAGTVGTCHKGFSFASQYQAPGAAFAAAQSYGSQFQFSQGYGTYGAGVGACNKALFVNQGYGAQFSTFAAPVYSAPLLAAPVYAPGAFAYKSNFGFGGVKVFAPGVHVGVGGVGVFRPKVFHPFHTKTVIKVKHW